jgi:hypothetical protein
VPTRHRRHRAAATALAVAACALPSLASPSLSAAAQIGGAGPLTRVAISPDLNCAVDHVADVVPEFFGDTACATLVATPDTLYGPQYIPAGSYASPLTPWTPVSQTGPVGSGTAADPSGSPPSSPEGRCASPRSTATSSARSPTAPT